MRTPTIPLTLLTVVLVGCTDDVPTALSSATRPMAHRAAVFPDLIALPNGFTADGISFGRGSTFYVGSGATGAIWRGDARTGAGALLVPPQAGRMACGLAYDPRTDHLFVAGSVTGQAYVYDAATGSTLGVYQLSDPAAGPTLIQGVAVMSDAVYFTDALRPVIHRIPLGTHGELPSADAVQQIPLTGDFEFIPGSFVGNESGIVATPGDRWLVILNPTTGTLYRVDPATGQTTAIMLGGGSVAGDGLAIIGHTLYVVQVFFSQVAVVRVDADFTGGAIEQHALGTSTLNFPAKIAAFGSALYVVNARFDVEQQVVRLSR